MVVAWVISPSRAKRSVDDGRFSGDRIEPYAATDVRERRNPGCFETGVFRKKIILRVQGSFGRQKRHFLNAHRRCTATATRIAVRNNTRCGGREFLSAVAARGNDKPRTVSRSHAGTRAQTLVMVPPLPPPPSSLQRTATILISAMIYYRKPTAAGAGFRRRLDVSTRTPRIIVQFVSDLLILLTRRFRGARRCGCAVGPHRQQ